MLFYRPPKRCVVLVHGDDCCAVGPPGALAKLQETLRERYGVNTEVLGGGPGDKKEVRVLNKVVQWGADGVRLEVDP